MLALLLVIALGADPSSPDAKAKEHASAARKLFSQKRYTEAAERFTAAYRVGGNATNIYNVGKCYERLGDVPMALRSYREYRRLNPKADEDPVLRGDIANGERRLREKGVQQLAVYAEPSSASITIDGEPLGTSPVYVELKAGEHVLSVSADGYETTKYSFVLSTAVISERTVSLAPAPRVAGLGLDAPREQPTVVMTPREPAEAGVPGVRDTATTRRRIGTWVSGGAAVAAAATAAGLGIAYLGPYRELHTPDVNRPGERTTALKNQTDQLSTGVNIALGVAGAAAAIAVILYFVEGR